MAKNISESQKRIKALSKLFDLSYTTDEAVSKLSAVDLLKIPDITTEELKLLCDLQENAKKGAVISFLSGSTV